MTTDAAISASQAGGIRDVDPSTLVLGTNVRSNVRLD
jgi:hypothetical protein